MRCCRASTCWATASQSVAAPAAAISSGRHHVHLGRAFVGEGDGDALAANVVEVHVVFLLDPLAQVLHGHVLLRQLDLEGAALLLQLGQDAALLAQAFLARRDVRVLGLLLRQQLGGLGVDLLAVVLRASQSGRATPGSPTRPAPCGPRRRNLAAPLLDDLGQLAEALLQRLPLLLEGGAHLLLGREAPPGFRSGRRWRRRAAGADSPVGRSVPSTCAWQRCSRVSHSAARAASSARFLQAFLFLGGQALNLIDDGIDLLVQQPLGILRAR